MEFEKKHREIKPLPGRCSVEIHEMLCLVSLIIKILLFPFSVFLTKRLNNIMMRSRQMPSMAVHAMYANNEGVRLFERGDFVNANHAFANAFRAIKEAIARDCLQPNIHYDALCSQEEFKIQAEPSCIPADAAAPKPADDIAHNVFIYQHAWRITNEEHIWHSRLTCQALSGVIVYNLALVHHLQANQCTQEYEGYADLLHKASRLYSCSQAIHMNLPFLDFPRALGTWNNLAHIQTLIGDNCKATKCWEQLLALIVYLSDSPSNDDDMSKDDDETKGLFIGNVMHLILKAPSLPAAA
jgi:hypothetical protein